MKYCIKCGAQMQDDMRFCISCGEENGIMLSGQDESNTERIENKPILKSKKENKEKIFIIAAVIATLIIICIVGIVLKLLHGEGEKEGGYTDITTSDTNVYNADSYKSAYVDLLYSILRSNGSYLDDADYTMFGIVDLDNDNTPELLVNYSDAGSYFTEFYYYDGNGAKRIGRYGYNIRPYQRTNDEAYCYFIPRKGTLIEVIKSYDGTETKIIYNYKNGQASQKLKIAKTNPDNANPLYFINDRVVSYDEYQKEYLKYNPEEIDPHKNFDDDDIKKYELTQQGISYFYSDPKAEAQRSTSDGNSKTTTLEHYSKPTKETGTKYVTSLHASDEKSKTTTFEHHSESITETTTEYVTSLHASDGVQYLFDMETFTGDPKFETISVTDTFDNEYKRMYSKNSAPFWSGSNEFSYLLDGKYSKINGTMIWAKAYKNDTTGHYSMEFYEGDKFLYETDECSYISGPINFSLNVTGIRILTVKFKGYSNKGPFDFVTNITIE